MNQKSIDRPQAAGNAATARRGSRFIARFTGVERSTLEPPTPRWGRGARLAFIITAAIGAWGAVFGLIALIF